MKRTVAMALLACACAHAPAPVQKEPTRAAAPAPRIIEVPPAILLKEARELMGQSKWDAARERLDAFLLKEPKDAAALFDAGFVAEQVGQPLQAQDFYRRALENDPGQAGAAIDLARLLAGQPAEAEQVLRRSLARREGDPKLLDALASLLVAQGKLDEAEAAARQVLSRHPRDAAAWQTLAAVEAARGHFRMAESILKTARKLDDEDPAIPHALGLLAFKRDEPAAARAWFEQATQLDPKFAPAWANLGALALRYRDYAAAEQSYAKALQLGATGWELHLSHGWALEGMKKPREARAEFEKVLEMRPAQDDALYGRALALRAEGDLAAALQAFQEYARNSQATHLKEAQGQIAAIDLRLKNPPRPATPKPAAPLDLGGLPQGSESEPSPEPLPSNESPAPDKAGGAAQKKDGGVAAAR